MTPWQRAAAGLAAILVASPAAAQIGDGLIVQSQIRQAYDRGRNVSVEDMPRPDYTPLGLRIGSFILNPRVDAGIGGTTNTYAVAANEVASPSVYVRPSVGVSSDWAMHQLKIAGSTTFRNYIGESRRNERLWNVDATGRLDFGRGVTVIAEASAAQAVESLFTGEVTSDIGALSRTRRDFVSLQGTYTAGRGRAFVVGDYTDLRFGSVPLISGGIRDQSDRDRRIARLTGQIEYARSPSLSLFAQLGGSRTRYDRDLLSGASNLDSKAVRLLAGANFDIAGRIRGTFGLGYSIRDFDASAYDTLSGVSLESRIQLFPLRRLTLTATAQRTIEDASLSRGLTAYWNNRASARADYEVLRNLIINASTAYSRLDYTATGLHSRIFGIGAGGRYLASRRLGFQGAITYNRRSFSERQATGPVAEGRLEVGASYQL
jgi:hypothetical protein